jgi:hypothetical protein
LAKRPLVGGEIAYLDVELWKMETPRLKDALKGIEKLPCKKTDVSVGAKRIPAVL